MPTFPVFAQDSGLTGSSSYESPTFGYVIEWSERWSASKQGTVVTGTGDQLVLLSDDYGARIDIDSTAAEGIDPQVFADAYLKHMQETRSSVEVFPADEHDAWFGQPAYFVTYTADSGDTIDDYFEIRIIDEALILVEIRSGELTGFFTIEAAMAEITLEGDPLFAYFGDQSDFSAYQSPTFGVSFSYDPAIWSVATELPADENEGRDLIVLESEALDARIFAESYEGYDGDASACIEAASTEVVGDVDQAELLQDANGDDFKSASDDIAWAAYAFEASDTGAPLNAYIECQALPGGAGVFVFTLISREETFDDAYDAGIDILETVVLDAQSNAVSDDAPVPRSTPNNDDGPNSETGERSG